MKFDVSLLLLPVLFACGCSAGNVEYVVYEDVLHNVQFELPSHWITEDAEGAEIFSGPEGGNEYYTTIVFYSDVSSGSFSLEDIASVFEEDIMNDSLQINMLNNTGILNGSLSAEPGTLNAFSRMEIYADYTTAEANFKQNIVIIGGPEYVYTLIYTAPNYLYETSHGYWLHLLATLRITGSQ